MKRMMKYAMGLMIGMSGVGYAWAGEAQTSAHAGNSLLPGGGNASATADYNGRGGVGIARTNSRTTNKVALAKGVAVGVDKNGIDLSFSQAIAPKIGPSYAGTFNLSIGRDGEVNSSYGGVVAKGGVKRSVDAGGYASSGRLGGSSGATATGKSLLGGSVKAHTESNSRPGVAKIVRILSR